jgi:hypothetical protein
MQMSAEVQARAEKSPQTFMNDPLGYFDYSVTRMHSVPRADLEQLQLKALAQRFLEQKERIPALAKLADRQGIAALSQLEDVLPVCFEHTVLKSYPVSLLEHGRFDKMTGWLNKITSCDLSNVDASKCDSIDSWIALLAQETELDPACSSGTTGTMSFVPRRKADWLTSTMGIRVQLLQRFGEEPDEKALREGVHVIVPSYADGQTSLFRRPQYLREIFGRGREDHFHPLYDARASTDIMFLAARLRAAAARGDKRVDVAPGLLARRGELEQSQLNMAAREDQWIQTLTRDLAGKRVTGLSTWKLWYDIAKKYSAQGLQCHFAPNSAFVCGGGAKGLVMAEDWEEVVKKFYGIRLAFAYGMSELNSFNFMCDQGRYHFDPWVIPFVLDHETGKPLPRRGQQVGRGTFFNLSSTGTWGGIISGDEIRIDWDTPCKCGRASVHISREIERYSDKQGGDDKITCAATPQAHAEAMEFITGRDSG